MLPFNECRLSPLVADVQNSLASRSVFRLLFLLVLLSSGGCGTSATDLPDESMTFDMIDSPASYFVYVTNEMSGDLSIIDPTSNNVAATVPLGKRPRGIHASPDGQTIYVALSGSPISPPGVDESTLPPADKSADGIGIFSIRERKLLRMISAGSDPEEFDLSPDGSLLYVSNEDVGLASVVEIATGEILHSFPVGEEPEGVTTSPDGKFVYVTSENDGLISVIDTEAMTVIKRVDVGLRPRDSVFLPDGSRAYVTLENQAGVAVIDAIAHERIKTITLQSPDQKPMAVILSPDAERAYVSTGRGKQVAVIDVATDEVLEMVETGGERPWGIGISPDGRLLYTANGPSNDVSVIAVESGEIVDRIEVGERPWGILVLSR